MKAGPSFFNSHKVAGIPLNSEVQTYTECIADGFALHPSSCEIRRYGVSLTEWEKTEPFTHGFALDFELVGM